MILRPIKRLTFYAVYDQKDSPVSLTTSFLEATILVDALGGRIEAELISDQEWYVRPFARAVAIYYRLKGLDRILLFHKSEDELL